MFISWKTAQRYPQGSLIKCYILHLSDRNCKSTLIVPAPGHVYDSASFSRRAHRDRSNTLGLGYKLLLKFPKPNRFIIEYMRPMNIILCLANNNNYTGNNTDDV